MFSKPTERLRRGTFGAVYLVESQRNDDESQQSDEDSFLSDEDYLLQSDEESQQSDEEKFVKRRIRICPQASQKAIHQEAKRFEIFTKLHHPNLINYKASFSEVDYSHMSIVTEYCQNNSLYIHVLEYSKPVPESKIISWFSQIVNALEYLHGKKFVHGDLRAKNVFWWPNDVCKVSDMRTIANKRQNRDDENLYEECEISLNAATHLPPEFWLCGVTSAAACFNAPADMFSLGCLLYFLCCQRDAFEGPDFLTISRKVCALAYPSAPTMYSNLIRDLIKKLMNHDFRKRPDSSTVKRMALLSQQGASDCGKRHETSAVKMESVRKEVRTVFGYLLLESESYPAEYSVDWSTLLNTENHPSLCPIFHLAQWKSFVNESLSTFLFSPLLLPTEFGVGENGMPYVFVAALKRDGKELILCGRLHEPAPDPVGPVKVRFTIYVHRKSRPSNQECEFTGEGVAVLQHDHYHYEPSTIVRIAIPWEDLCVTQAPRAVLRIENKPNSRFWFAGLLPFHTDSSSKVFPIVDWTSVNGSRNGHLEWKKMVKNRNGILHLPPLRIPFENDSGETDYFYLVSFLEREGSCISHNAFIHPESPLVADNITMWLFLQIDIPRKSGAIDRTIFCMVKVCLRRRTEDGTVHQLFLFELQQADWRTHDMSRTPKMTVHINELDI